MFSADCIETFIKFYPVESKVSYQVSVAHVRFACCNSQQANRGLAVLSTSPSPQPATI
jgi:hypothetical protein